MMGKALNTLRWPLVGLKKLVPTEMLWTNWGASDTAAGA